MDYSEHVAQVLRELEEPSGGIISDTSLMEWTNDAYKDFATKTKCLEDEQYATAIVGQAAYDLPDYTLDAVAVAYDTRPLSRVEKRDYFYMKSANSAAGTPGYYTVFDNALHLYPPPAGTGTIHFWRTYRPDPVVSTDSTDDLPFDGDHNDAIRYYVKARAFEQIGDDRANYFTQKYEAEVAETLFERGRRDSSDSDNAPVDVY